MRVLRLFDGSVPMFKKTAILQWTCSIALLACAALPCVGQQIKSGGANSGKSGNLNPVTPPLNPFNPLNPYAPSSYRGFGLSNPAYRGPSYNLNNNIAA